MHTLILAVSFDHSINEKGSPGMCDQSQDEVSRRDAVSILFFLSSIMKRRAPSS